MFNCTNRYKKVQQLLYYTEVIQINILKIDLKSMNQIELFGEEKDQQNQQMNKSIQNNSRMNDFRPDKVQVQRNLQPNRWRQCKIIGKNVTIRSYSASCAFQGNFYIYGGYQILNGMMSDFYWINLKDQVQKFDWIPIQSKGQKPGPRSKHALVAGKSKIYLVGGLCTDINSSNQIFSFDPESQNWEKLNPVGDIFPCIDSFGSVYLEHEGDEKIIIIGGYDGQKAEYLNAVYEYNITKNKVSILYAGTQQQEEGIPKPRSGCAAATDGKKVWMFGGKDAQDRFNDLWQFNLTDFKYKQLCKNDAPSKRNGHTLNYYQGKLYLFGGIHDITWQLDDLLIFHLNKNIWITLQQDSPRKIERKSNNKNTFNSSKEKKQKNSPKKKIWYETQTQSLGNRSVGDSSPNRPYMTAYRDQQHQSPGKMIDQQRKKAFLHKKNQMLKNFEINKDQKDRYVILQTSSQAMKNSLDVIGNPDPSHKIPQGRLTQFGKHSASKFLQPLANNTNLIPGKKPCARDGHCSAILNNQLIIFGGDRHQMSFSDIYKLNLGMASKQTD